MSKNISLALLAHYAQPYQTLARIYDITLRDGSQRFFTDLDVNITFEGHTYVSASGYAPSNMQSSAALSTDNLEISGFLLDPYITRDELLSGLWTHAKVVVRQVNYEDLTMGAEILRTGRLGSIKIQRNMFTAEFRGLTQQIQRNIGELTSASCRYDLGDSRCMKDVTLYTVSPATIIAVNNQHSFTTNLPSATVHLTPGSTGAPTNDYFQGGKLLWLTGANAVGQTAEMECEGYTASSGTLTLTTEAYFQIAPGDTFTVVAGCNKLLKTAVNTYNGDCKIKFGNVVNFGGEPEVVGEKIMNVGTH